MSSGGSFVQEGRWAWYVLQVSGERCGLRHLFDSVLDCFTQFHRTTKPSLFLFHGRIRTNFKVYHLVRSVPPLLLTAPVGWELKWFLTEKGDVPESVKATLVTAMLSQKIRIFRRANCMFFIVLFSFIIILNNFLISHCCCKIKFTVKKITDSWKVCSTDLKIFFQRLNPLSVCQRSGDTMH